MSRGRGKSKTIIRGGSIPHQDLNHWTENWFQIPGWPATWKAPVEETPGYFPSGAAPYLASLRNNRHYYDPVGGKTPAEAVTNACVIALPVLKISRPLPAAGSLKTASGRLNKSKVSDPVIVDGDTFRRDYKTARDGFRLKPAPYPAVTKTFYIPYTDDVLIDFDEGSGNYDSYETRNHSINYNRLLEIGDSSGSNFELPYYSTKEPEGYLYVVMEEYDILDYYEGDTGLVRFMAAFDNLKDAKEAAYYECLCH